VFSAVSQSIISIIFLVFCLTYLEKAVRKFCLLHHSFDNDNILPKHLLFSTHFIFTGFNYLYPLSIHLVNIFIFTAFHYLYLLLIDWFNQLIHLVNTFIFRGIHYFTSFSRFFFRAFHIWSGKYFSAFYQNAYQYHNTIFIKILRRA